MRVSAQTMPADLRSPLRILASLAEAQQGLSIEELMQACGAGVATVRVALQALEAEGFVIPDVGGARYVLGGRFLRLADAGRAHVLLEHRIRPIMRQLSRDSGETTTLNTYECGALSATCVLVEQSPAPLHYVLEVGDLKPLHAGASGKVILAQLGPEEIEVSIARSGLPAVTGRTTTDPVRLRRELQRIRRHGYATSRGQRLDGAVAFACATFRGGEVHGSLVITIPQYRFRQADASHFASLVKAAAARVSEILDGKPPA